MIAGRDSSGKHGEKFADFLGKTKNAFSPLLEVALSSSPFARALESTLLSFSPRPASGRGAGGEGDFRSLRIHRAALPKTPFHVNKRVTFEQVMRLFQEHLLLLFVFERHSLSSVSTCCQIKGCVKSVLAREFDGEWGLRQKDIATGMNSGTTVGDFSKKVVADVFGKIFASICNLSICGANVSFCTVRESPANETD